MRRLNTFSLSDSNGRPVLPASLQASRVDFYREEFVKLQQFLDGQRECFSEHAISEAECALMQVMASLEELCGQTGRRPRRQRAAPEVRSGRPPRGLERLPAGALTAG